MLCLSLAFSSLHPPWCRNDGRMNTENASHLFKPKYSGMDDVSFQGNDPSWFFFNFYLFVIVTERERDWGRDTGRARSRLHAPGARRGIRSRVSRIAPWAKGRCQTTSPPRDPYGVYYTRSIFIWFLLFIILSCFSGWRGIIRVHKCFSFLLI